MFFIFSMSHKFRYKIGKRFFFFFNKSLIEVNNIFIFLNIDNNYINYRNNLRTFWNYFSNATQYCW